jgi:hypothetical protein
MYFKGASSLDELKKLYRKLALENHPDKGGDVLIMQTINKEYEEAFKRVSRIENRRNPQADFDIDFEWEQEQGFVDLVNRIIGLDAIQIEIVGKWIWVTGSTYPVKAELKAAGCFWASKKKCWFWRPEEHKSANRKDLSLDQIREKYGSQTIKARPTVLQLA